MKKIPLSTTQKEIPVIAAGCMRIDSLSQNALCQYIETYMEAGINFFDHADIYGNGICEELFGKAFIKTGIKREDVIIQSKCGI